MSSRQLTYKNHTIVIENGHLFIDQKEIEYELDHERQKWSSWYLPYTQYDSLGELAKAIIVDTDEFNA